MTNGLLLDVETLHVDRRYDSNVTRQRVAAAGLDDVIIQRRGTKTPGTKQPLNLGPHLALLRRRSRELVVVELRPTPPPAINGCSRSHWRVVVDASETAAHFTLDFTRW